MLEWDSKCCRLIMPARLTSGLFNIRLPNREMGCVCTPAAGSASPMRQFRVALLPPSSPPKRLRDYFPKPKTGPPQRGRR